MQVIGRGMEEVGVDGLEPPTYSERGRVPQLSTHTVAQGHRLNFQKGCYELGNL